MTPLLSEDFQAYRVALAEARVPARQYSYYVRWLNVYRQFCRQRHFPQTGTLHLEAFVAHCQSRYADWQCRQAEAAVRLLGALTAESALAVGAADCPRDTLLAEIAQRIKCRVQHTIEEIIAIGLDLILAKEMLPHGQFRNWLQQEFEMSYATANRMMRVADVFCDKVITVRTLSKKALYALSAPDIPPEVREQVFVRLDAGERLSWQDIEALKHQPDRLVDTPLVLLSSDLRRCLCRTRRWLETPGELTGQTEILQTLMLDVRKLEALLDSGLRRCRPAAA